MKPHSAILWLLAAACLLLDAAAVRMAESYPTLAAASLVMALAFSQAALLASWASLGSGGWRRHTAILAAGLGLWLWLLSDRAWEVSLGACAAIILAIGMIARRSGLRWAPVERSSKAQSSGDATDAPLPWSDSLQAQGAQVPRTAWTFSLPELFLGMTVVAAGAIAVRLAYLSSRQSSLLFAAAMAAVAVTFTTTYFRSTSRPTVRTPAVVLMVMCIGYWMDLFDGANDLLHLRAIGLQSLLIVAMAEALRMAGFRLQRTRPEDPLHRPPRKEPPAGQTGDNPSTATADDLTASTEATVSHSG